MILLNENLPVYPERVFELAAIAVLDYRMRQTTEEDFIPDDLSPERTNVKIHNNTVMVITLRGIQAGTVRVIPINPSLTRVEITANGRYEEFIFEMQRIRDRLIEFIRDPRKGEIESEDKSIPQENSKPTKTEMMCIMYVTRPHSPFESMNDFIKRVSKDDIELFFSERQFQQYLRDAEKKGLIKKNARGRWILRESN